MASTYIGADGIGTTAVDVVLGTALPSSSTTRTLHRDDVPVTHARERCLLEHLAQLRAALEQDAGATATIDVPDVALAAARDA
jgi:hypothetical protein